MNIPEPRVGLIVRYSFLWSREAAAGLEEGSKDRPCAIVLVVKSLDGKPIVAFAIFRAKGASEMTVRDGVEAKLAELRKEFPDISMTNIDDAVAYTQGNFEAAMETLIEGSVLAVIVVLIFLRNWRAVLIKEGEGREGSVGI